MKACHVTTVHPLDDNRIFYKEVLSLKNAGYNVCLLIAGEQDHVHHGVQVYGIPKARGRLGRMFRTSRRDVLRRAMEINAELYHLHDPELMWLCHKLKKRGKKVVYDIHENVAGSMLSRSYLGPMWIRRGIAKLYKTIEKHYIKKADALVTATSYIDRLYRHPNKEVIKNFPILPERPPEGKSELKKDRFIAIYTGALTETRGVKTMLEAFGHIEGVELWLLGQFESQALEAECRNMPAWEKTKYHGLVHPVKVYEYLFQADIGLALLHPEKNYLESLPTKAYEYMAAGLPMLISGFPYWKQIFNTAALYANPLNPSEIAEKLKKLTEDTAQMRRIGQENKKTVYAKYSWQHEAEKLLQLYTKMNKNR